MADQATPPPLVFFERASVQPPPRHRWGADPDAREGWRMCIRCCLMHNPSEWGSTRRYPIPECHG